MIFKQFFNKNHDGLNHLFLHMTQDRSRAKAYDNVFGGLSIAHQYTSKFTLELIY